MSDLPIGSRTVTYGSDMDRQEARRYLRREHASLVAEYLALRREFQSGGENAERAADYRARLEELRLLLANHLLAYDLMWLWGQPPAARLRPPSASQPWPRGPLASS